MGCLVIGSIKHLSPSYQSHLWHYCASAMYESNIEFDTLTIQAKKKKTYSSVVTFLAKGSPRTHHLEDIISIADTPPNSHLILQCHEFPSIPIPSLSTLHHLVVIKLYVDDAVSLDRLDHHALEVNR